MHEPTIDLLGEVVKNAEMGKNVIQNILDISNDESLNTHLQRHGETYEDLKNRANAMLAVEGSPSASVGKIAKMSAKINLAVQTMTDKSTRNIAEMLINTNNLGVTDMQKALHDYPDANPGALALAQRLQSAEDQYAGELSSFL